MVKLHTRLYIPHLGDELTLTKDWTFTLQHESRNERFGIAIGLAEKTDSYWPRWVDPEQAKKSIVDLPKGTVLAVDRIYIRHGARDFDSVTFRVRSCSDKRFLKKRFWANLLDVNLMEVITPPQL